MYADKMTASMEKTIEETARRREMQIDYNKANGLVPTALNKSKEKIMRSTKVADGENALKAEKAMYQMEENMAIAAEPKTVYKDPEQLEKMIKATRRAMESAAKVLDFVEAARLRDELFELQKINK
jgi:excinuclease ABC subunit B